MDKHSVLLVREIVVQCYVDQHLSVDMKQTEADQKT